MNRQIPDMHKILISSYTSELTQEEAENRFRTPLKDIDLDYVQKDYPELNIYRGDTVLIDKSCNSVDHDGVYRLSIGEDLVFVRAQLRLNGSVFVKINNEIQDLDDFCGRLDESVCITGKVLPYKAGRF